MTNAIDMTIDWSASMRRFYREQAEAQDRANAIWQAMYRRKPEGTA